VSNTDTADTASTNNAPSPATIAAQPIVDPAGQELLDRASKGLGQIDLNSEIRAALIATATGLPMKANNIVDRVRAALIHGEVTEEQLHALIERMGGAVPGAPSAAPPEAHAASSTKQGEEEELPTIGGARFRARAEVQGQALQPAPMPNGLSPEQAERLEAARRRQQETRERIETLMTPAQPAPMPQATSQAPTQPSPEQVAEAARRQIRELSARLNAQSGRPQGLEAPPEHRARRISLPLGEAELGGGMVFTFEAVVPLFANEVPFAELRKLQILPFGADRCVMTSLRVDDVEMAGGRPTPGTMLTRSDGAPTALVYPGATIRATFANVSPSPIRLSPSAQIVPLERDRSRVNGG